MLRSASSIAPNLGNAIPRPLMSTAAANLRASTPVTRQIGSDARKLLANGTQLSQHRGLVTQSTWRELQTVLPQLNKSDMPPFQKPSLCEFQATGIVGYLKTLPVHGRAAAAPPAPESSSGLSAKAQELWSKCRKAFSGDLKRQSIGGAADCLALYQRQGSFTLRTPGLGEVYEDHAVAVFAVLPVTAPDGTMKTVVCVLDCNDLATDPQTSAAREIADTSGRPLHELTHDEAEQQDAHLRRIRFIDGDALFRHAIKKYGVMLEKNAGSSDITPFGPEAISFKDRRNDRLAPNDEEALIKHLTQIYDTNEVEKSFSD